MDFRSLSSLPYFCHLVKSRELLASAAAPISSAAFPLGGASIIIAQNTDAHGVFESPHLYWPRKMFIFVPGKLVRCQNMILLKRLWASVHSQLIPTVVCSDIVLGPSNSSFRICSTDLNGDGKKGKNIKALHKLWLR